MPFFLVEVDGGKIKIQDKDGNMLESVVDGEGNRRLLTSTILDDSVPSEIGPLLAYWEEFTDAMNLRPVACRGIGDFAPNTQALLYGPDRSQAAPMSIDTSGNLVVRGDVMTDEQSFREDFPGSALKRSLTGLLTVLNGDQVVTGNGTAFLSEIQTGSYIKVASHTDEMWARVDSVISDEEIFLAVPYPGADASDAAGEEAHYIPVNSTNITVASSKATLASGTTTSQETSLWRYVDYLPLMVHSIFSISARRTNQEAKFGLSDNFSSLAFGAVVVFDGTVNTICKFRTANNGTTEESTVSLPSGYDTSQELEYQISVLPQECTLSINGVIAARHRRHIPRPYDNMAIVMGWLNGGSAPAGSSSIVCDGMFVSNHNRVEIAQTFHGEALPVQIREDVHTINALRSTSSTSEVELIAYTVPAGKTLHLIGYCLSADDTSADGHFKIGKGSIPLPDPANPGTVDSNLLRGIFALQKTTHTQVFNSPLYAAAAGEVFRVTIKPTSTVATSWRAAIDFILR